MSKFLIVDDNLALAENVAEIISDADLGETVLAENGARALELAAAVRFDVLVSDVRMPGMSGLELFRHMRLLDPGLVVVFLTAHAMGDELVSARHDGILCILPKPVPIARLLAELADARREGRSLAFAPTTDGSRSRALREPKGFGAPSDPERAMSEIESLCG